MSKVITPNHTGIHKDDEVSLDVKDGIREWKELREDLKGKKTKEKLYWENKNLCTAL